MKKIILVLIFSLLIQGLVYADEYSIDEVEVSVMMNGEYLNTVTPHMLIKDKVFIVAKYLVYSLGGKIEWDGETQSVKITVEDQEIELVINSTTAKVNGEVVELYKAPFIRNGRTMLPIKFVAEQFGFQVAWHPETYTVSLEKEGFELPKAYRLNRSYTDEDLYVLAKIVTVESGDVSLEMAMAIANTVLNRVKDPRFPNSVEEVIYQVDRYVQFPPAHKASFDEMKPSTKAIIAAKRSLEGVNPIGYSLYFNNAPFRSKPNDLIRIIDGEYFYY